MLRALSCFPADRASLFETELIELKKITLAEGTNIYDPTFEGASFSSLLVEEERLDYCFSFRFLFYFRSWAGFLLVG